MSPHVGSGNYGLGKSSLLMLVSTPELQPDDQAGGEPFAFVNLLSIATSDMPSSVLGHLDVEFSRTLGSQSGVSVWQHTLVG